MPQVYTLSNTISRFGATPSRCTLLLVRSNAFAKTLHHFQEPWATNCVGGPNLTLSSRQVPWNPRRGLSPLAHLFSPPTTPLAPLRPSFPLHTSAPTPTWHRLTLPLAHPKNRALLAVQAITRHSPPLPHPAYRTQVRHRPHNPLQRQHPLPLIAQIALSMVAISLSKQHPKQRPVAVLCVASTASDKHMPKTLTPSLLPRHNPEERLLAAAPLHCDLSHLPTCPKDRQTHQATPPQTSMVPRHFMTPSTAALASCPFYHFISSSISIRGDNSR